MSRSPAPHWVIYILLVALVSSAKAYSDHFYTAAIFEHALHGNWTEERSDENVQANLQYYKNAAAVAKSKDVDIIVFPEYGIFQPFERLSLKHYLEFIPNPKEVRANPCEESELYSTRPILKALSCIARDNNLVVVANTGDIQPCKEEDEEGCHDDGHFHFNANVAFDSDGTLIGRYHKEHLFFEKGMDLDKNQQDPTFKTNFGTFAMFSSFDIVFKRMTETAKQGVEGITLSAMWIDPAPFMSSVQLWQSWALVNNVTFLVANINIPGYFAAGSGIFHNKDESLSYTFNPDRKSKLLVAKVPRTSYRSEGNLSESSITVIHINGTEEYKNDGSEVPKVCSRKILGDSSNIHRDYRCLEEDTSNYTFVKLNNTAGHIRACNNGLCCTLDYVSTSLRENFYLGVYNGTYNMFDRYFWCVENCLLVRCDEFNGKPCATFPMKTNTKFQLVHLSTNATTEYVYPSVLGSGVRLVPKTEWAYGFRRKQSYVRFKNSPGRELLVVGLNGRCYDRDPPYIR